LASWILAIFLSFIFFRLLELKRFISSHLGNCQLSQSLATSWKQDFNLNFISILEHLHFGVTIPFAGNFSKPFAASSLSVPKEILQAEDYQDQNRHDNSNTKATDYGSHLAGDI
jgi:hypothetical protein